MADFVRSQRSLDFEEMWRGLPRAGVLPDRLAFQPRVAKKFLSQIIVMQAPSGDDPTLRIRLVGDAIRQQIADDIVGSDYLEFMDPERRPGGLEIVRAMFKRPCGIWSVAPVHYERGFSQYWEVTAFPLLGDGRNPPVVLGLVKPSQILFEIRRRGSRAIRVDVATQFQFIEVDG
jgi:hypothetical protein